MDDTGRSGAVATRRRRRTYVQGGRQRDPQGRGPGARAGGTLRGVGREPKRPRVTPRPVPFLHLMDIRFKAEYLSSEHITRTLTGGLARGGGAHELRLPIGLRAAS